jgi:hypothetical protein
MARVAAVLKMTAIALWRKRRSLLSVMSNNFFGTIAFLFFFGAFVDYTVGIIFYVPVGLLLLFPLSADPLQIIPPERLALWPLSRAEDWLLRVLAPWLNPITWLFCVLVLWSAFRRDAKTAAISAGLMIVIVLLVPLVPTSGRNNLWRRVPRFPGIFGQLIRKNMRQLLSMLDFWLAALLSIAFLLYRLLGHNVAPEARTAFSLLVVLALSTASQTFFALDGFQGLVRYHLLPVSGWQVLVAKAAAWMMVVLVLTTPLSLPVGLSAAFAAIPIGCWSSVSHPRLQHRWRFAASPAVMSSVALVLFVLSTGVAVFRISVGWAVPALLASLLSIAISGKRFDGQPIFR